MAQTTADGIAAIKRQREKGQALLERGRKYGFDRPEIEQSLCAQLKVLDDAIAELEAVDATPGTRQFGQGQAQFGQGQA